MTVTSPSNVLFVVLDTVRKDRLTPYRYERETTTEWAYRTFDGEHDLAYFSGNPFINSLEIPLNELTWGASCDYAWTATDHIGDVIDVWKHGWDDELGTVPPESIEAAFREHGDPVGRRDRTILHYMQPHAPYLGRGGGTKLTQIRKGIDRHEETTANRDSVHRPLSAVGEAIRPRLERFLGGNELAMKAGMWLELEPTSVVRAGVHETALGYYEENLRIVLEAVADLIPELDGTVVVTADHGEAFGEEGVWEHHIETHIPPLMEVPWLVVE